MPRLPDSGFLCFRKFPPLEPLAIIPDAHGVLMNRPRPNILGRSILIDFPFRANYGSAIKSLLLVGPLQSRSLR